MLANLFQPKSNALPSASSDEVDEATSEATYAELNQYLELLCEVFPEADVDNIRDRLSKSSKESRLYVVTETLLRNPSRGARRRPQDVINVTEKFRTRRYQTATKNLLHHEFKGLSKSTIQAVMMENNYDYCKTRRTLAEIASKSWRFSVSAFFRRRKAEIAPIPEFSPTGCEELDAELRDLGKDKILEQIAEDRKISALLDEAEHAAASDLVECETCYGDFSWNEIAACSEGHFICYSCLVKCVQESLYGQGQNIVNTNSSIRCLSAAATPACDACIPPELVERIVPENLLRGVEDKAASESLDRSGLDLIRCPFCPYAEVDDLMPYRIRYPAKVLGGFLLIIFCILLPGLCILLGALVLGFNYIIRPVFSRETSDSMVDDAMAFLALLHWDQAVKRVQLKRHGALFKCGNVRCKRESCIYCSKEWTPFHKCYEKEEDNVRIYVEKAMANAVKRTCPVCHVSFVKSDGCNKLTCVCGYVMCYICRADIRTEGYKHFCQHFRLIPGTTCPDCDQCDLYVQEDEDALIREAAAKAEEEYFKNHDVPKSWKMKKDKVGVGVVKVGGVVSAEPNAWNAALDMQSIKSYIDAIVAWMIEDV